ncbi:MAG: acyl carrier protein [Gammaproteobacteria bacterium]|nr:acyl carrier protein [Gammaproteobacteria bacterium]
MKKTEIEQTVRQSLSDVTPEVDPAAIDPDRSFRDQFDFDSMDYLALMMDLDKKLGIHISEIDYPRLSSLSGCVQYLDEKLRAGGGDA